jgi:hypothetical protein
MAQPTALDEDYALAYARDVITKEYCLAHPDVYTWIPAVVTTYPCPEGLVCEAGKCMFNETGCKATSYLPYYDCKRKTVACDMGEECEVCEYAIRPAHKIVGPYADEPLPPGCNAGDFRAPEPGLCQPAEVRSPVYTIDRFQSDDAAVSVPTPVPCATDEDCYVYGVGGVCGASTGMCEDNETAYVEWRKNVELWSGYATKAACVEASPMAKRWCEMPWTRSGVHADDPNLTLQHRVNLAWKTKARPPFWYNPSDGTCHVTKTYCTANTGNGGLSSGYGDSTNIFSIGEVCKNSSGGKEVQQGADCCATWYDSIPQFFLGRTISTDIRQLLEGDPSGFEARWEEYLRIAGYFTPIPHLFTTAKYMIEMACDPRLKQGARVLMMDVFPGVHAYEWTWTTRAGELYSLRGRDRGLMTNEVRTIAPSLIHRDTRTGYDVIRLYRDSPTKVGEVALLLHQSARTGLT